MSLYLKRMHVVLAAALLASALVGAQSAWAVEPVADEGSGEAVAKSVDAEVVVDDPSDPVVADDAAVGEASREAVSDVDAVKTKSGEKASGEALAVTSGNGKTGESVDEPANAGASDTAAAVKEIKKVSPDNADAAAVSAEASSSSAEAAADGKASAPSATASSDTAKAATSDKAPASSAKASAASEKADRNAEAAPSAAADDKAEAGSELVVQSPPTPIADGVYAIQSGLNKNYVLDVAGGSKANGANVQIYGWNETDAQKWTFKSDADGYYTITSKVSGKALDVSGGSKKNGANVQTWASNGTAAQKWLITKDGAGYRIESALKTGFVLDVQYGSAQNGTNVWMYTSNGTAAQVFYIFDFTPKIEPSTATLADGVYTVKTSLGSGKVLEVAGGSIATGGNVRQYSGNDSYGQRFYVESDGAGFYRLFNLGSGLALDIAGGNTKSGANVQQWTWNGTDAQLWSLQANSDGTITVSSKLSGLVLDISGGSTANGANLQMWTPNGTKSQKFKFAKADLLSEGMNAFASVRSTSRVMGLETQNKKEGTALVLAKSASAPTQKFEVSSAGSDEFTIQVLSSGLYVEPGSGGTVVQGATPYQWSVEYSKLAERRGIVLYNTSDALAIAVSAASEGSPLKTETPKKTASEAFLPSITSLIEDGTYYIRTALGSRVLTAATYRPDNDPDHAISALNVGFGSDIDIEVLHSNTDRQVFDVKYEGGGYYRLVQHFMGHSVDTQWGGTANGTNVWFGDTGSYDSQMWKIAVADAGGYTLTNKASGRCLDVAGGANAEGVNVQIWDANGSKAQRWNFEKVVGDKVVERAEGIVYDMYSPTNYLLAVDLTNTRICAFTDFSGSWELYDTWKITCGASDTPTITGTYYVGSKQAVFGDGYNCYYATQISGGYLFHSILYTPYDDWEFKYILDGQMGKYASHGCVRNQIERAKWIYDNVPGGSRIYIYW